VVRCPAELPDRDRLCRGEGPRALACAAARSGQGHHALPHDHLAGDATSFRPDNDFEGDPEEEELL